MKNTGKKKTITDDIVRHVAKLSRLHIDESEITKFREQLARILEYITQLNEVGTKDTFPTTHVLSSMKNVFRKDEPAGSLSVEEVMSNAPEKKENLFKVPRIIGNP
ncbi:MAG: Asp-tRNA(Asn)/Glu-tRNA(Gln) amidotransferase subunit GatC [Candidatus Omnitrophota bacterium]